MRRKHLKFTDFQGRQLQDLLDSHLGIQLTPQTRAVVQSAGRTINIWVLTPAAPDEPAMPAPMPPEPGLETPAELAHTDTLPPARYSWQNAVDGTDDLLALNDNPLTVLSAVALRSIAATRQWPTLGMALDEFNRLQAVLGDSLLTPARTDATAQPSTDAVNTLREWLWSHRRSDRPLTRTVAAAVACASFSQKPLWVDLGLTGRDNLNTLLNGHFPALYRLNTTHMGWKKFFMLKQPELQQDTAEAPGR